MRFDTSRSAIGIALLTSCAALCGQNPKQEANNQKLVLDWYREVIAAGHVNLAPKYMANDYVDHDPSIAGDRNAFVAYRGKAPARPAGTDLPAKPVAAFAKGDYVVLAWEHADKDPKTGTPYRYITYDITRVKNGKVQEHWDSLRKDADSAAPPVPSALPANQLGHGDAPPGVPMQTTYDVSSLKYTPAEKKNINVTVGYYRDCVQSHHPELVYNFLAGDEINHNPNDPATPPGLMAMLSSRFPNPEPLHKEIDPLPNLLIAKDDMVLLMYDQQEKDPTDASKTYTFSRVEMVRLKDERIQEHWDVGDRRENAQSWKLDWCAKAGRKDCPTP